MTSAFMVSLLITLVLSSALLVNFTQGQKPDPFGSSTTPQSFQSSATQSCSKLPVSSVKASGTQSGLSPFNSVDGEVSTRWSNLGLKSWIQVDLGKQKTICNIDIAWYRGDERVNNFIISGSNDGINFVKIFSGKSSGLTTDFEKYNLNGANAKFIRITVTGNTQNNWISISEIRVNGYEISSDTVRPTAVSTVPASGAKGVSTTSLITATFSEKVQRSTVTTSSFLLKNSAGASIPGTVSLSADDMTATFDPTSSLAPSTSYTATISPDPNNRVMDPSGNRMVTKTWSFSTVGAGSIAEFNFAAVGDWSCNSRASETIAQIQNKNPELVLALGDFSYKSSPKCWLDKIKDIEGITRVTIGNHDSDEEESSKLEEQYLDRFNLANSFYSFDYKNAHFLMLSSQLDASKGDEQYNFVNNDLNKAALNKNIDWIIVALHKPLYTSPTKHSAETDFRNVYHPLFDKYGVDLVLQAHNHNYQRSYPMSYNSQKSSSPIITDNGKSIYDDPNGAIFVIAGTGGRSLYDLNSKSAFIVTQQEVYGMLDVKITNGGTKLTGTFYANDGNKVGDTFSVSK